MIDYIAIWAQNGFEGCLLGNCVIYFFFTAILSAYFVNLFFFLNGK